MEKRSTIRNQWLRGIIFAALVFLVALIVRGYRIGEIQPHHDESPAFGFSRGKTLEWNGEVTPFLDTLFKKAAVISEGDSPPLIGITAELFRFFCGENLTRARWFHAIIHSLGIAIVGWLALWLFPGSRGAVLSVVLLSIFSVSSIFYGQFGEVYAVYFMAGSVQYLVYWCVLRRDFSWYGYLAFIVAAYLCGLFEYIQVWLTLGLLIAGILEANKVRRHIRILRTLIALILYGILNLVPFFFLMAGKPLSVGHVGYYLNYYPDIKSPAGIFSGIENLVWYGLTRTYDLFDYHLALVFNSRLYRPLHWNWIMLPFILFGLGAVFIRIRKGRDKNRGVIAVLIGVLGVFSLGNFLSLLPYGGLRNTLLLAPIIWLSYGEVVSQWDRVNWKRWSGRLLVWGVVIIPVCPFLISLPAFYRDRIARLDMAQLEEIIERYRPDTLILAEASYDPFRMILQRHPEFQTDVLDQYRVKLTSFFELGEERWGKYPLPVPGEKVLALDFYLPYNGHTGKDVGYGIFAYHPSLSELSGPDWEFEVLLEEPGKNVDMQEHQSIYYPPNSVYLYLMQRK